MNKIVDIMRVLRDQKITLKEYKWYKKYLPIERCPICGKYTFGDGYICRICKWEADGVLEDVNEYSHANCCSIADYRKKKYYYRDASYEEDSIIYK